RSTRRRFQSMKTIVERPREESDESQQKSDDAPQVAWVNHQQAPERFAHYVTFLYALLLIIFLVIEDANHSLGEHQLGIFSHYYA
ncbi:hypothetical protein PENTCL1PPCAC_14235, partial [Pristionchus entomophagus]